MYASHSRQLQSRTSSLIWASIDCVKQLFQESSVVFTLFLVLIRNLHLKVGRAAHAMPCGFLLPNVGDLLQPLVPHTLLFVLHFLHACPHPRVCLNLPEPGGEIDLQRAPHPRILASKNQLMADPEHQENRNADVRRQEAADGEAPGIEVGEAVAQEQDREEDQADPRHVRLDARRVRDRHALRDAGLAEAQVDDGAEDPRRVARGVGQADEPVEDDAGLRPAAEVGQRREAAGRQDGVYRQPPAVAAREDLGSVAGDGEGVDGAAGHVEVSVARGPGAGQDSGVDDGREDGDAGVLDSDDPRRGIGVARA